MICLYGGCDAFGYCPCAEDPPDDEAAALLDDLAEGRALLWRGRVRPIDTLPPLDDYHPQGRPCPFSTP